MTLIAITVRLGHSHTDGNAGNVCRYFPHSRCQAMRKKRNKGEHAVRVGSLNAVSGSTSCSTARRPSFRPSIRCPTSRESPCGSRLLSVFGCCPHSRHCVNIAAAAKHTPPPKLTMDEPAVRCQGIGIRDRASITHGARARRPARIRPPGKSRQPPSRPWPRPRMPLARQTCRWPPRPGDLAVAHGLRIETSAPRSTRRDQDPVPASAGAIGMMQPRCQFAGTTPRPVLDLRDILAVLGNVPTAMGGEGPVIGCGIAYAREAQEG